MAWCNSTLFLVVFLPFLLLIMTAAPSTAIEITAGPVNNVNEVIMIDGFLYCTINSTVSSLNVSTVLGNPRTFSDTAALLRCGNKTLAKTTEFTMGLFRMTINSTRKDVQALKNFLVAPASNCTVAVTTPRSICNATLPAGITTLVARPLLGPVENSNDGVRIHHILLDGSSF